LLDYNNNNRVLCQGLISVNHDLSEILLQLLR
jgi:hypothetical protein